MDRFLKFSSLPFVLHAACAQVSVSVCCVQRKNKNTVIYLIIDITITIIIN